MCAYRTAVIVIPTSNEAGSIGILLDELIHMVFPATQWNCQILVVDADSPDGTADIVRRAQKSCEKVHLIVEQRKEGLGAAYFKGFRYAVEILSADAVVEFDGDLQHPPNVIPALLAELDKGADLVLGSRRRPGGSYPRGWSLVRRFLSEVGGFASRVLLFFPLKAFRQVTDPTTGLKATRVDTRFRGLDFESFLNRGFGYKLEMLFRLVQAGAKVTEVPLQFRLREAGESKMQGQAPWEILWSCIVLRLRDEGTRRFLKFAAVVFPGTSSMACSWRCLPGRPSSVTWQGTFISFAARCWRSCPSSPAGLPYSPLRGRSSAISSGTTSGRSGALALRNREDL